MISGWVQLITLGIETCKSKFSDCLGHFELVKPTYHVRFIEICIKINRQQDSEQCCVPEVGLPEGHNQESEEGGDDCYRKLRIRRAVKG